MQYFFVLMADGVSSSFSDMVRVDVDGLVEAWSSSGQFLGMVPGSTKTDFVYVIQINSKMMFEIMSSFLLSGEGSSCRRSHCEG